MRREILIRQLRKEDCPVITEAFLKQNWQKPFEQFERYLAEQEKGGREVLVAEMHDEFAGYVTIVWESKYPPFRQQSIPEINDFNVLIKLRKKGVGTALLDAAEKLIAEKAETAGIGVGLTPDYGAAQRLYINRGYVPDGKGIFQRERFLKYGDPITVDDDLSLWLTKRLAKS